jgi:hypothetical protein
MDNTHPIGNNGSRREGEDHAQDASQDRVARDTRLSAVQRVRLAGPVGRPPVQDGPDPADRRGAGRDRQPLAAGDPSQSQLAGIRAVERGPGTEGAAAARSRCGQARRPGSRKLGRRPRRGHAGPRRDRDDRRRPAGLRRQQHTEVLSAHPKPEPARLLRRLLHDLHPALLHDGLPEGPGHPQRLGQHQQVLPEVDLQHGQRGRRRGLLVQPGLRRPREARGRDLGRVPLRHQLPRLVPRAVGLAQRPVRPVQSGPVGLACQHGRWPGLRQGAPQQRVCARLRHLHLLLAVQDHR